MAWATIIGQGRVKELLQRTITHRHVAHAYLFFGPAGIGKDALALEFAKVLNCERGESVACDVCPSCVKAKGFQNANIHFITALPLGKGEKQGDDPVSVLLDEQLDEYRSALAEKSRDPYVQIELEKANFMKINSIRQIKRETAMTLSNAGKKVFLISQADRMNADASNSLLKTLEEPPADTILLLTTSERNRLLPTILSRCQLIQCDPLTEEEIAQALIERDAVDETQAKIAAELANGSYLFARELSAGNIAKEREEVVNFLRFAVSSQRLQAAQLIESLVNEREKQSLERWLRQLQAWLREAMLLRETNEHRALASDREAQQKFVQRYSGADLIGAIGAVEASIVHLRKNVYLQLVFLKLLAELRKHIVMTP